MNKHLFTVRIDFEDRTFAMEQTTAETPTEALRNVCQKAEALAHYDKTALTEMLDNRIILTHLAGVRGVWNWHPKPIESEATADIFGGNIVQTDENGPQRNGGA
ncbi:MAG: hypothetical protein Q8T11_09055 [Elusimicrobiota bacterium]|nr:hypothetical protein [Elusimicrobiota bacterium]